MEYFVFVNSDGQRRNYRFVLQANSLKEVNVHMNNKKLYPIRSAYNFMVINGNQLSIVGSDQQNCISAKLNKKCKDKVEKRNKNVL